MWTKYLKSTRQMELKIDKWQRACLPSIWIRYWLDKNESEPFDSPIDGAWDNREIIK